eukprot:XP_024449276.1 ATP-dependent Clp protease proteolytic subunit-related protein 3, chloroplastic-like [Populus trichocarpa]
MARTSCFQVVLPLTTCSLPSSTLYSKSIKLKPNTIDNLRIKCFASINARNSSSSSNIPMPPINPKDPFLSKLASIAATSPDSLLQDSPVSGSDTPPYLDIFESPKLMATPAQVERSVSYNEHRPRTPPPDLPSLLLHGRIVYIGMPVSVLIFTYLIKYPFYLISSC